MYALIENGAVTTYPYSIGMLRRDNPQTSFPKNPDDTLLSEWGMLPVTKATRPSVDHTQNIEEGTPSLVNGSWVQVWNVTDASADEITKRLDRKATENRSKRDSLLAQTDWVVIMHTEKGTNIPADMELYRQALRDITSHANWPNLSDSDWPTKP